MASNRKVYTLRIKPETYERVRFLAYIERRSIAQEIENILSEYADAYEKDHGPIPLPELNNDI